MISAQRKVAFGASSGIISMVLLVGLLYWLLPAVTAVDTLADRIAFALRMNIFAMMPLFVMLAAVGNGRFFSDAIDPLKHKESTSIEINGRVADNTLQQNVVFLAGTLALSTFLTPGSMKLIVALTVIFILARVVFWIGYRMHPLYRAPGMAATSYLNLGVLASDIILFIWK